MNIGDPTPDFVIVVEKFMRGGHNSIIQIEIGLKLLQKQLILKYMLMCNKSFGKTKPYK